MNNLNNQALKVFVSFLHFQCIMCEDWFHGRHLIQGDEKLPKDENYAEMICFMCCEKFESILSPYVGLSLTHVAKSDETDGDLSLSTLEADEANEIGRAHV